MSIQKKLVFAFGAMIAVPLLIFTMAAFIMFLVYGEGDRLTSSRNELERIEQRDYLFGELKLLTTSDPAKLSDHTFLKKMDNRLSRWEYGLFIRLEGELVYTAERFKDLPVKNKLPSFGEFKNQIHESVNIEGKSYKFRQHDYFLPNRQKGSIFIVEEASAIEQFLVKYMWAILLVLVLTLIVTNGILSYVVSKSFINPLKMLQKSMRKIMKGDLHFELKSNRKDEIGELISDFETMRSKLKESIEKQLQYENDRKLLISNISHDLKTPISSIKGYVEGIKDGIANTEEKREKYIDIIYKRANEMDVMINDLFLVSTLDLKQVPFYFEKINLSRYLNEIAEESAIDLGKKGITLELKIYDQQDLFIRADREKLTRVISNITENSAKYMDKPEKRITLSLHKEADKAVIKINDNGPGISEQALPYIFETFYRAEASRNKKTGGTGLGLTIARQIVEGHQGSIHAESMIGKGTTIFVILPLEKEDSYEKNLNYRR